MSRRLRRCAEARCPPPSSPSATCRAAPSTVARPPRAPWRRRRPADAAVRADRGGGRRAGGGGGGGRGGEAAARLPRAARSRRRREDGSRGSVSSLSLSSADAVPLRLGQGLRLVVIFLGVGGGAGRPSSGPRRRRRRTPVVVVGASPRLISSLDLRARRATSRAASRARVAAAVVVEEDGAPPDGRLARRSGRSRAAATRARARRSWTMGFIFLPRTCGSTSTPASSACRTRTIRRGATLPSARAVPGYTRPLSRLPLPPSQLRLFLFSTHLFAPPVRGEPALNIVPAWRGSGSPFPRRWRSARTSSRRWTSAGSLYVPKTNTFRQKLNGERNVHADRRPGGAGCRGRSTATSTTRGATTAARRARCRSRGGGRRGRSRDEDDPPPLWPHPSVGADLRPLASSAPPLPVLHRIVPEPRTAARTRCIYSVGVFGDRRLGTAFSLAPLHVARPQRSSSFAAPSQRAAPVAARLRRPRRLRVDEVLRLLGDDREVLEGHVEGAARRRVLGEEGAEHRRRLARVDRRRGDVAVEPRHRRAAAALGAAVAERRGVRAAREAFRAQALTYSRRCC